MVEVTESKTKQTVDDLVAKLIRECSVGIGSFEELIKRCSEEILLVAVQLEKNRFVAFYVKELQARIRDFELDGMKIDMLYVPMEVAGKIFAGARVDAYRPLPKSSIYVAEVADGSLIKRDFALPLSIGYPVDITETMFQQGMVSVLDQKSRLGAHIDGFIERGRNSDINV